MSLSADILTLRTIHLQFSSEWNNIANDFTSLASWLTAEGNPNSGAVVTALVSKIQTIKNLYMGATPSMRNTTYDILHYIDENLNGGPPPDPYVLTMDKILAALWDTDKLRNFQFINFIDAMRASIWNVEIYETHLAEWYRHFSL